MSKSTTAASSVPAGSKTSDCLVMEDGNVAVRDIDSLTDGTAAKVRFIGAQTCVVC